MRTVLAGNTAVILQTITFAAPGDQEVRDQVDALHAKPIVSLHLI